MNEVFERYCIFTQDTEQRLNGKTAKFWIQQVYLIHIYRNFTRGARAGDVDLHVFFLPEITNMFFPTNRLIYAWNCNANNNSLVIQG